MLEHAAICPNSLERSCKAAVVVALDSTYPSRRTAAPIPAPALAGRVCYDRIWPSVLARVTVYVPWIYAIEPEVCAARLHKERGDHFTACSFDFSGSAVATANHGGAICCNSLSIDSAADRMYFGSKCA